MVLPINSVSNRFAKQVATPFKGERIGSVTMPQAVAVKSLDDGKVEPLLIRNVIRPESRLNVRGQGQINHNEPLAEALRRMRNGHCDRLGVVDDNGKDVGIVTQEDVISKLSPERLYIDFDDGHVDENILKHLARYRFAESWLPASAKVLDGACGAGYGTAILSSASRHVVGVDISEEAIDFAEAHYSSERTCFIKQDLKDLTFGPASLDAAVTLETLEHVSTGVAEALLRNLNRWVKPGGILVASSPMLRFRNGQPYITSPYHVNELPRAELLDTFKRCLPDFELDFYHQKITDFTPLAEEDTGFCIAVGQKHE